MTGLEKNTYLTAILKEIIESLFYRIIEEMMICNLPNKDPENN